MVQLTLPLPKPACVVVLSTSLLRKLLLAIDNAYTSMAMRADCLCPNSQMSSSPVASYQSCLVYVTPRGPSTPL